MPRVSQNIGSLVRPDAQVVAQRAHCAYVPPHAKGHGTPLVKITPQAGAAGALDRGGLGPGTHVHDRHLHNALMVRSRRAWRPPGGLSVQAVRTSPCHRVFIETKTGGKCARRPHSRGCLRGLWCVFVWRMRPPSSPKPATGFGEDDGGRRGWGLRRKRGGVRPLERVQCSDTTWDSDIVEAKATGGGGPKGLPRCHGLVMSRSSDPVQQRRMQQVQVQGTPRCSNNTGDGRTGTETVPSLHVQHRTYGSQPDPAHRPTHSGIYSTSASTVTQSSSPSRGREAQGERRSQPKKRHSLGTISLVCEGGGGGQRKQNGGGASISRMDRNRWHNYHPPPRVPRNQQCCAV